MIFGFAQLCALLMLSRHTRWLLLPLGLLFLPVYDMVYPRADNSQLMQLTSECIKQRYPRKRGVSTRAELQDCFNFAEAKVKNAAKAQK